MLNNVRKGANGEEVASAFLQSRGYAILATNFRLGKVGELDLVCRDGATLVFVEVKMRMSAEFGRPEDSVSERKRKQLRRVAKAYLHIHKIYNSECRFDVIAIEYREGQRFVRHWRNAFF
ncbi:MAG: YraN family protein [Candidatus Kapaibacterium sp.]|jgi:putative endonuclease